MKRFFPFAFLCVLCVSSSAFARIGETEAQITDRYGKTIGMISEPGEILAKAYASGGFHIIVAYVAGTSQSETFWKTDKTALSPTEIETLLEANSSGRKWVEGEVTALARGRSWKLDGGVDRTATYHTDRNALMIRTRVYEAADTEKEKEKLKGF